MKEIISLSILLGGVILAMIRNYFVYKARIKLNNIAYEEFNKEQLKTYRELCYPFYGDKKNTPYSYNRYMFKIFKTPLQINEEVIDIIFNSGK